MTSDKHRTRKGGWIGRSVPRIEDARLIAGAGRFVDDLAPPGCLHLDFVRSAHARGVVGSIDIAAAAKAPGVVAVFKRRRPRRAWRSRGQPPAARNPRTAFLRPRWQHGTLALDPVEFRRRNLIGPDEFPFATPTGQMLDSGDYPLLLAKACERADYVGLRFQLNERRRAGAVCGIGVALYIEPCGQGWESARVSLAADGRIGAATGSTEQGQGRETAFAQIVASVLGVPIDKVVVRRGDTAQTPPGIGALASRSTAIGGSAMLRAAEAFRDEARRAAAAALQCREAHLAAVEDRFIALDGTGRSLTWRGLGESLCSSSGRDEDALSTSVVFHADGEAWSSGCCIAVVAIDPETGVPTIEKLTWVDDAGVVLNPMLAHGQLVGGMAQGLGEALIESVVYDGAGQLITGSLMDYAIPRATAVPHVDIDKLDTPSPTNPVGAKGVGEAGCIGIPAAIVNAVVRRARALRGHPPRHAPDQPEGLEGHAAGRRLFNRSR